MAREFQIRFDDDGKIIIKDEELIRRIRWLLEQDRRLTLVFDPKDPEAYLANPKCPPELYCPPPLEKCPPGPDVSCPEYQRGVPIDIWNGWARERNWKNLGSGSGG